MPHTSLQLSEVLSETAARAVAEGNESASLRWVIETVGIEPVCVLAPSVRVGVDSKGRKAYFDAFHEDEGQDD